MKIPKQFEHFDAEAFLERCRKEDSYNGAQFAQKKAQYDQMLTLAISIYGELSNEVRYLRQHRPSTPMSQESTVYVRTMKRYRIWLDEKARRDKQRESRHKRQEIAAEALGKLGFVQGRDFSFSSAPEFYKKVKPRESVTPDNAPVNA